MIEVIYSLSFKWVWMLRNLCNWIIKNLYIAPRPIADLAATPHSSWHKNNHLKRLTPLNIPNIRPFPVFLSGGGGPPPPGPPKIYFRGDQYREIPAIALNERTRNIYRHRP